MIYLLTYLPGQHHERFDQTLRARYVLFIRASPQPARPRIRVGGESVTAGAARLTTSLVAWEAALRHPRSRGVGRMPVA